MRTCAIISEYNPFHNGHKYQIEKVRESGITHIVSIMSSNFTQRGTPAIMSKISRTKSALLSGVDLVIELPTVYSAARAQNFAFGGVFLANALNCVDFLSFGCETCDIELLKKATFCCNNNTVLGELKKELNCGLTFAKARQNAINSVFGNNIAKVFSHPNNNLALEYISALNSLGSKIVPLPVARFGASHSNNSFNDKFCSSSYIREHLNSNSMSNFLPKSSFETLKFELKNGFAPANINLAERAILYKLRTMKKSEFSALPDISEGLDMKLYNEVKNACSLNELCSLVKSKRYTLARIKRIILSAYLGITKEMSQTAPPYIKVLGFNKNGEELLKIAKEKATLPIISKYSDVKNLNDDICLNFYEFESFSTDLYSLTLPSVLKCSIEKNSRVVKV